MEQRLRSFAAPLSFKNSTKLPYSEVLNKLNQIEKIYTEIMGQRSEWGDRANQCLDELRMTAICRQTPEIENLECQYESGNSYD